MPALGWGAQGQRGFHPAAGCPVLLGCTGSAPSNLGLCLSALYIHPVAGLQGCL